jgi:dolichyl-phosphate-mannose--protein O-mannosyl transferase
MSSLSLYLVWAVLPKQGGFFYYYFPTAMMLSPALGYVFFETPLVRPAWLRYLFLIAAFAMFLYFLPVSSAATGVTLPGYAERMWFDGWR